MPPEANATEPLIADLLHWLAKALRTHADVMDAWRTSCPRLPVWEEANARGFISRTHRTGSPATVGVSEQGLQWLAARQAAATPAGRETQGPRRQLTPATVVETAPPASAPMPH